ncbi:MAG: hypothetical protein NC420_14085 [Eubacterium sp.]|nr:hypothetical protein [Eubacterium sp.]MCM1304506.1 hypothetical protein [Butyrivibrio sp.]MCM1343975.1 hypothetical protein [Muribaculaceae bacterium]MCM1411457.1 hypothetical protein [Lachnospiraceae bacterium]
MYNILICDDGRAGRMSGKNRRLFCIVCVFSLILVGCGRDWESNYEAVSEDNVHILYDLEALDSPGEAAVYSAEWYAADAQLLQENLFVNAVDEEMSLAEGNAWYAYIEDGGKDVTEALILYDSSHDAGMKGGFTYGLSGTGRGYHNVAYPYPGHPSNISQIMGYNFTEDFRQDANLGFLSADSAVQYIESVFSAVGAPTVKPTAVYALDADTLNAHEALRHETKPRDSDWTKEEEAYLVQLAQVVDNIPLADHMWVNDVRSEVTETPVYVVLSQKGIESMHIENAVQVLDVVEQGEVLSPEEAESLMLQYYTRGIAVSDIYVEEMNLRYVGVVGRDGLTLIPAWIFCISRDHHGAMGDEEAKYREYEHFVIHAITGDRIEAMSALDGRS